MVLGFLIDLTIVNHQAHSSGSRLSNKETKTAVARVVEGAGRREVTRELNLRAATMAPPNHETLEQMLGRWVTERGIGMRGAGAQRVLAVGGASHPGPQAWPTGG